jgi:hypothetical protein
MTRNSQIVHPGLGKNYLTPQKPGRRQNAKDSLLVALPGRDAKRRELLQKLHVLDEKRTAAMSNTDPFAEISLGAPMEQDSDWIDDESLAEPTSNTSTTATPSPRKRKPRDLDYDIEKQYARWKEMLPCLVQPFLKFINMSSGKAAPVEVDMPSCSHCNTGKMSRVLCLFWDRESSSHLRFLLSTTYSASADHSQNFSLNGDFSLLLPANRILRFPSTFSSFIARSSSKQVIPSQL